MGDAPADKRIDFLRDRIVQLLKCKPELFDALLKTEEGELIKRFLNDGGCTRIFFSAGPKDMFVTEKLPDDKQTKKKAIFAMKLAEDVKFDEKKMDEMFDLCMVGDLSPAMLNNLYNTLRSVYLPIITNPGFINAKPGVVMKQFIDKYNWMLAAVHTAVGQTQGKTALWLPPVEAPSAAGSSKDRSDKDRVHVLESAIVMWTERINTVRRSPSPPWLRLPPPPSPPRPVLPLVRVLRLTHPLHTHAVPESRSRFGLRRRWHQGRALPRAHRGHRLLAGQVHRLGRHSRAAQQPAHRQGDEGARDHPLAVPCLLLGADESAVDSARGG